MVDISCVSVHVPSNICSSDGNTVVVIVSDGSIFRDYWFGFIECSLGLGGSVLGEVVLERDKSLDDDCVGVLFSSEGAAKYENLINSGNRDIIQYLYDLAGEVNSIQESDSDRVVDIYSKFKSFAQEGKLYVR